MVAIWSPSWIWSHFEKFEHFFFSLTLPSNRFSIQKYTYMPNFTKVIWKLPPQINIDLFKIFPLSITLKQTSLLHHIASIEYLHWWRFFFSWYCCQSWGYWTWYSRVGPGNASSNRPTVSFIIVVGGRLNGWGSFSWAALFF